MKLSANPASVTLDGTSDFTVVVGNTGAQTATGVTLTVTLPAGTALLGPPAYDRGAGCTGTGPISCNLDFLPVGASSTIRFSLRFGTAGAHVVTAGVSSREADLAAADNTASTTVTVAAPAAAAASPLPAPAVVKPVLGRIRLAPARPVAGKRATATVLVRRSDTRKPLLSGRMSADLSVSGRVIRHAGSFRGGVARLGFTVPKSAKGKQLRVTVTVRLGSRSATRAGSFRVTG